MLYQISSFFDCNICFPINACHICVNCKTLLGFYWIRKSINFKIVMNISYNDSDVLLVRIWFGTCVLYFSFFFGGGGGDFDLLFIYPAYKIS